MASSLLVSRLSLFSSSVAALGLVTLLATGCSSTEEEEATEDGTAQAATGSTAIASAFCGDAMFKVDTGLPKAMNGHEIGLDLAGRVDEVNGKPVEYDLLGRVTKLNGFAVEYDIVGRVTKLNNLPVEYDLVGRAVRVNGTSVERDIVGRVSEINGKAVGYSFFGLVDEINGAPVEYRFGSVTEHQRGVLCLAAYAPRAAATSAR